MRIRLALVCVLSAAMCLGAVASASAAQMWSAPELVDQSAAHVVGDYLMTCPSQSQCVGVGSSAGGPVVYGLASTGEVASVHAYGLSNILGSGEEDIALIGLECPSVGLCLGTAYNRTADVIDAVRSTDPAAGPSSWVEENLADPVTVSSCPTASFCAGVDSDGGVAITQAPSSSDAWTITRLASPADPDGPGSLDDVDCPSTDLCVAYDEVGDVWTSTDPTGGAGAWTEAGAARPLRFAADKPEYQAATGIFVPREYLSCAGPNLCIAAGPSGEVLVNIDPAGSGSWIPVNVSSAAITALACEPGTTVCLVGNAKGDIFDSDDAGVTWTRQATTDTGGIGQLSCTAQTCTATGQPTTTAKADSGPLSPPVAPLVAAVPAPGGTWHWHPLTAVIRDAMGSISCPSGTECIGTDGSRVYISARPTAGAGSWHARNEQNLFGDHLAQILDTACYSATGCLAVTRDGNAGVRTRFLERFDPVGGVHHLQETPVGGQGGTEIYYVSCAQGTCVAGRPGRWFQSSNPASQNVWPRVTDPRFDTTCLHGNASCVALAEGPFPAGAGGDVLVASRRTGPWTPEAVDPGGYIDGLACPSTGACVIVDQGGRLLVSTAPTSGPASWTLADTDPNGFNGIACENAHTCVAVDDNGGVVVGRP